MDDSRKDFSAAILVGRLIRSYRDDAMPNGRRLTQEGLLNLMVVRGEKYAANLDRSAVSHWERGTRLAPREFLVALGRTCDIPKPELDRMLCLAGYDDLGDKDERDSMLAAAHGIESRVASIQRDIRGLIDSTARPEPSVDASAVVKSALWRMAPAGVYALVVGFILNAMGLNGTLALLVYVCFSIAIVIGQGVSRWLRPSHDHSEHDHIVDLFFISLFFNLNVSLVVGALTKADHFGIYTFNAFTNTPMTFLFAMLAHLALALAASVIFSVLWSRQSRRYEVEGKPSAFSRALWITLPPILFAYANIVIFTNLGGWIYFLIIFGVLFGAFTTIVALNETEVELKDAGFVLKTAIVAIMLLSSFGVIGTLLSYLEPDMAITASEFRIIPLPKISAEELGYTPEEGVELLRLGILWMSLAAILYLVTVVGGYLIATISRVTSAGDISMVPGSPTSES